MVLLYELVIWQFVILVGIFHGSPLGFVYQLLMFPSHHRCHVLVPQLLL
jgi:hypothetical protein